MNDTIKIYTRITKTEGLQMLLDNGANAISGLAFRDNDNCSWRIARLDQINCDQNAALVFCTPNASYYQCAKVTEEPIAEGHNPAKLTVEQVGELGRLISKDEQAKSVSPDKSLVQYWRGGWQDAEQGDPFSVTDTYRTQKPVGYFLPAVDPFNAWFRGMRIDPNGYKETYREAYELGQANPKKGSE